MEGGPNGCFLVVFADLAGTWKCAIIEWHAGGGSKNMPFFNSKLCLHVLSEIMEQNN